MIWIDNGNVYLRGNSPEIDNRQPFAIACDSVNHIADILMNRGINYLRSIHLLWNLITGITWNNGASCGWCDARRLIQCRRQNATAPKWIIQVTMAVCYAPRALLSCENVGHSCTHLLHAIINLGTAGL